MRYTEEGGGKEGGVWHEDLPRKCEKMALKQKRVRRGRLFQLRKKCLFASFGGSNSFV